MNEVTLEELIKERTKGKGKELEAIKEVFKEVNEGKIRLIDPEPPNDYVSYLRRTEYSAWLWTTVTILALTALSILTSSASEAILYLRYVLGAITVLYLPGYATIELLYPKGKDLSPLERLALSIGLSLALVPLIGLILNYTPWGIRLGPVATSLIIYTAIAVFAAGYRKYSIMSRKHELIKAGQVKNSKPLSK